MLAKLSKLFFKFALDANYKNIYIRFGRIPKGERSNFGLDDEWKRELGKTHEFGVSVYKTYYVPEKINLY